MKILPEHFDLDPQRFNMFDPNSVIMFHQFVTATAVQYAYDNKVDVYDVTLDVLGPHVCGLFGINDETFRGLVFAGELLITDRLDDEEQSNIDNEFFDMVKDF